MTDTPRYLDGFLAAVRAGHGRAVAAPPQAAADPEPGLSAEERIKRRLHPLDSFARLMDCAASDRPPDSDDRFRFQWFGLFHQAPRQDAFLLRLRLPGGRLEPFQLAALADITQELASGHVILNPQGGLDIPGVPVRAAVEILRRTEGIGLSARQTGGDCVRSVRGGEDEGCATGDPSVPVYPLVCKLEQALAHHRALADLPRGCEIAFQRSGEQQPGVSHEGDTDTLVLQAMPMPPVRPGSGSGEGNGPCFLLVAPGELEGGFVLPATRVVSGCVKLLEVWAARVDRTDRQRAGLAMFCAALGREQVSILIGNAPWQPWLARPETGPGYGGSNGNVARSGFAVPGGRLLSSQLILIERIVREYDLGGIRLVHRGLHTARAVDDAASEAINLALSFG